MPCNKCEDVLILNDNFQLWCAKCSDDHILYSKEETFDFLENRYIIDKETFKRKIQPYNTKKLIKSFHMVRNTISPSFFLNFFALSKGLNIILQKYYNNPNKGSNISNGEKFNELLDLSRNIFLHLHHKFFSQFDAIRYVDYINKNIGGFKYTEKWIPIYKRQYLMGNHPLKSSIDSEQSRTLYLEFKFRRVLLNKLHKINEKYSHITETFEYLQFLHFFYPWSEYLNVGRGNRERNLFIEICEKMLNNVEFTLTDFKNLKKNKKNFIRKRNWVSKEGNIANFPFIIKINENMFLPNKFLEIMYQIYHLFSPRFNDTVGNYKRNLGEVLEDWIYKDLEIFNLQLHSPKNKGKKLLHFENPLRRGEELLDVGAIDKNTKRFYVIECKNKIQLNLRTYDPRRLNDYIIQDFNEFKNRDIPRIENILEYWDLSNYKIIPLFYNFVPLFGEFKSFKKFQLLEDIYIIQNRSEIISIINTNFKTANLNFNDVISLPEKFQKIINNKLPLDIDPSLEPDIGDLINEPSGKYLIIKTNFIKLEIGQYIDELWVRMIKPPNRILYVDIPPDILPKVESLNLNKGDTISILIYRKRPYSPVIILGDIWELN